MEGKFASLQEPNNPMMVTFHDRLRSSSDLNDCLVIKDTLVTGTKSKEVILDAGIWFPKARDGDIIP